jgi:hypothetical protein
MIKHEHKMNLCVTCSYVLSFMGNGHVLSKKLCLLKQFTYISKQVRESSLQTDVLRSTDS